MSNQVYANGREVSCKAADGKSIAAFPDVCFTPPQTPATPPGVPIPYPNTGMASDTSDGSKTVQISGKEVMLKDSSAFQKSSGDEAGCAPKKNVITSKIQGKCYYTSWSMDVKIEGENAVRHLDMMTHNHASQVGATPPWPYSDAAAAGAPDDCRGEKEREKAACEDKGFPPKNVCEDAGLDKPIIQKNRDAVAAQYGSAAEWADEMSMRAAEHPCIVARRCKLVPYNGKPDGENGCCPSQTPDHLIPKASFFAGAFNKGAGAKVNKDFEKYDYNAAPCMCAEGASNTAGSHGLRHAHHKANGTVAAGKKQSFAEQKTLAAQGANEVFKASGCSQACIEAQLEKGHKDMGCKTNGNIKHAPSGSVLDDDEITERAASYPAGTAGSS
jgi:uncharacterized Zn-binding protein involved in type VI secretion